MANVGVRREGGVVAASEGAAGAAAAGAWGGGVSGGGVVGLPRLGEGRHMLVVALGVGLGVDGVRVAGDHRLLREAGKALQAGCCREKEIIVGAS